MSWRRDLDLLHGEEVDIVLKPHPLSFTKHNVFFLYLIITVFLLRNFQSLIEENASLFSLLRFLDAALSRLGMNIVDMVFLASFWIVLILSGWVGTRLLHTRLLMIYVILIAASGTTLEIYWSITRFELAFIKGSHIKLILLAGTAIAAMILIEIHRRRCLYIVTNRRVIAKRGLTLKEEEITYDEIYHVRVEQGILGRVFNFGTVILISIYDLESNEPLYEEIPEVLKQFEGDITDRALEESSKIRRRRRRLLLSGVPNPRRVRVIIGNRQLEAKEA